MAYESGTTKKQTDMGFPSAVVEQTAMNLPPSDFGRGDLTKIFGPRDVFDYIYAVLHSPAYRTRYADFLKSDFPRIPLPGSAEIFRDLVPLGRQLVAVHLLDEAEATILAKPETRFVGKGEARVEKTYPKYENGKVMINPSCHFEDVTPDVWEFHIGGYQVCRKWLKDRAGKGGKNPHPGRVLTDADILHYRRITIALRQTISLMQQVDEVINKHGGWPGAFAGGEIEDAVVAIPDMAALPDNAWAASDGFGAEDAALAAIVDTMRYLNAPAASTTISTIANLARFPLLAVANMFDEQRRQHWVRLVGDEARPLPDKIISLSDYRNDASDRAWGAAVQRMKATNTIMEADDGTWSMGDDFPPNSRQDWMQGRISVCASLLKDISVTEAEQNIVTFFKDQKDDIARGAVS